MNGLIMARARQAKKVIVNADDFGFSRGITEGILRAHREGIVTSATITTNMPAAEEAVARLAEAPALGVGVHLNACQGPVLSPEGAALAGEDGCMRRSAIGVMLACLCRPWLLRAIEAEFDAQIRWLLDRGLRPTHLDSHRHVHAFSPIFAGVMALARRYDIGRIRWSHERLAGGGWPAAPGRQRRLRWLVNRFSEANSVFVRPPRDVHGTWGIAHTGRIDADWLCRAARAVRPGVTEIMTHPGADDGGEPPAEATRLTTSRRTELEALCSPRVRQAFAAGGIELVHYGQL
jgi:predicted glycoside hydrolase/deacetylase ChbG (UPF0249 family)